jgi:hypothetical protein
MPEGLTQTKTPTPKTPAGFKSECRPVSFRNRGRLQIGTVAGFKSEYPAGINRNPHEAIRASAKIRERRRYRPVSGQTMASDWLPHRAPSISAFGLNGDDLRSLSKIGGTRPFHSRRRKFLPAWLNTAMTLKGWHFAVSII